MMMKMMMRMKTKKTRYHCQRKQNLSPNNGNCLWTVPVDKTGSYPSPLQNPHQSAVVSCEWLTQISSTLDFCSSSANSMEQEEGDAVQLGGRHKPVSSPAWTTRCPFLREGNGNKKPTGQGFCQWNSGLTGRLLQSKLAFLDHVWDLEEWVFLP